MSKYYKRIAREVKNSTNRFLNWPINNGVKIGDYGFYDGRKVILEKQGNLEKVLGRILKRKTNTKTNYSFRSRKGVHIEFDVRDSTPATAEVKFDKKHKVMFESYHEYTEAFDVDDLLTKMLAAISNGKLSWRRDFVIVTQIHKAKSFSCLISGDSQALSKIRASRCKETSLFNLADPEAGLGVVLEKNIALSTLAERDVVPYFELSRLIRRDNEYFLKRYGKGFLLR